MYSHSNSGIPAVESDGHDSRRNDQKEDDGRDDPVSSYDAEISGLLSKSVAHP